MSATATKATTGKSTSASARRKPRAASKPASPAKRSTKTSTARTDSEPAAATPPTKGTKAAPKVAKAPTRSKGAAATATRKATAAAKSPARAKPESAAAVKASAPGKKAPGASTKSKAASKAKTATAKTTAKSTAPVKAARPTTESKAAAAATPPVEPDGQPGVSAKKAATARPAEAAAKPAAKAKSSPKPKRTAARKRAAPRPEGFKNGNWVVHPSHGPGRVVGSERLSVGGETLELITIAYGREMARLKIPVSRIQELGLRPISSKAQIQAATNTLKKPARISRTMWSRRAQDYESKLHSGDLVQIAEVLRDLYRAPDGPEQSFSERELYKDALDRFSREIAAAEKNLTEEKAAQRLESVLRRAA
jgi:CarD family transcriptional regulator